MVGSKDINMEYETKVPEITELGGVRFNEEKTKEVLWQNFLSGKSLQVTKSVYVLEMKYQELFDFAKSLELSDEQRVKLNEFML